MAFKLLACLLLCFAERVAVVHIMVSAVACDCFENWARSCVQSGFCGLIEGLHWFCSCAVLLALLSKGRSIVSSVACAF